MSHRDASSSASGEPSLAASFAGAGSRASLEASSGRRSIPTTSAQAATSGRPAAELTSSARATLAMGHCRDRWNFGNRRRRPADHPDVECYRTSMTARSILLAILATALLIAGPARSDEVAPDLQGADLRKEAETELR